MHDPLELGKRASARRRPRGLVEQPLERRVPLRRRGPPPTARAPGPEAPRAAAGSPAGSSVRASGRAGRPRPACRRARTPGGRPRRAVGGRVAASADVRVVPEPELRAAAERLLDVVADDLVVVAEARAGVAPGASARSLVEIGAHGLRHPAVRDVADQRVAEPQRVLARHVGADGLDEALARERRAAHRRSSGRSVVRTRGRRPRCARTPCRPPRPARARGARPARACRAAPRGAPGSRPGARARRPAPRPTPRPSPRAARRRAGSPRRSTRSGRARPGPRRRGADELARLGVGQVPELEERVARPARARLEQLRAGVAEQHDRPGRERGEVLDEVEHRRLGPVHVLEADERAVALRASASRILRTAQKTSSFGATGPTGRRTVRRRARTSSASVVPSRRGRRGVEPAEVADELDERPVRDPGAVRQAAAAERRCASSAAAPTTSRASRDLPIPAGPVTPTTAATLVDARLDRRLHARRARRPARPAARRGGARSPAASASTSSSRKRSTASRFPFAREPLARPDPDSVLDERVGRRADQDLPGWRPARAACRG